MWLRLLLIMASSCLFKCSISAQLFSETFDYPRYNSLNLSEGGLGSWEGHWYREKGLDVILKPGDLVHPAWPEEENGTHLEAIFRGNPIRFNRSFPLIEDDGQALWVSVLMEFLPGAHPNNVGNITLLRNGSQVLTFGRKFGNQRFGLVWPGATNYNSDIPTEGLHWVVMKLQFSGNSEPENAWLWIDPLPNEIPEEASAALAVPTSGGPQLRLNQGIDGVQVKVEGTPPLEMRFDRLLFGRSFAEVSPLTLSSFHATEPALTHLQVFPNPASDFCTLEFEPAVNFTGQWKLYDLSGKPFAVQPTGLYPEGRRQRLLFELGNYPAGWYQVCLENANRRSCTPIIKSSE